MNQFQKSWHRRDVLRAGAIATASMAIPLQLRGQPYLHVATRGTRRIMAYDAGFMDRDATRALAMSAIDAAKGAGATFADVRITRTVSQSFMGAGLFSDGEVYGIGVRALVNGAWGFAASPYLTVDEAALLARSAVEQAGVNARASSHHVEMGSYPVVTGTWSTPVRIEPFSVPIEEKIDFARSFEDSLATANRYGRIFGAGLQAMGFYRQERAVANTEGSYFTQTIYSSGGMMTVSAQNTSWRRLESQTASGQTIASGLEYSGRGWELFLDAKLRQQIPRLAEEADASMAVPRKPVDVGRYDLVVSAGTMAGFVASTLGAATELDRALGYEANAGGTSYLGPYPLKLLGQTMLGTPLFSVTGDRSMEGGLATVQWDDEGVEPETFPLVQQGLLADYQTTREQAAWLAPWYQAQHRPVRSHGCAGASTALAFPTQFTPNLSLAPGERGVGDAELIANTKRGLWFDGSVGTDFQSRSGLGYGSFREIINGKLGAFIEGAGVVFDSSQIWKSLRALGGPEHRVAVSASGSKGQPTQRYDYSVSAVPGVFANAAIVDLKREQ